MTTQTSTAAGATASVGLWPALAAALIGLSVIFTVGHVQAETLHDAAHDVRHATGFPCH